MQKVRVHTHTQINVAACTCKKCMHTHTQINVASCTCKKCVYTRTRRLMLLHAHAKSACTRTRRLMLHHAHAKSACALVRLSVYACPLCPLYIHISLVRLFVSVPYIYPLSVPYIYPRVRCMYSVSVSYPYRIRIISVSPRDYPFFTRLSEMFHGSSTLERDVSRWFSSPSTSSSFSVFFVPVFLTLSLYIH